MEEQNCQHFSLRGYVAEMRVNNPNVCNPFEGRINGGSIWDRLRGPLHVPRFRWSNCENCVRRVVGSSTSAEQRLNAEHSLQISLPVAGKKSTSEHRAARGDLIKTPVEVIILDDSEDEEVKKDEEKASAGRGVLPTNSLRQTEKRPCLDKGKSIIIEVEDDGEEFDGQPYKETRKALGESFEDNDQTSGFLEPSGELRRGPPYRQAVLNDLNARIARTANTLQNQQQQKRNTFSNSTLDLSLSLCIPRTEGSQKVKKEGMSVESNRKRKATFDALDYNVSESSSLKSRKHMEMGKYLGKPFTSCEIIDLESASFNTDGTTKPVTTAYAKHANADPIPRNYAKPTGEPSRPGGEENKGPVKKTGSGANPPVQNMSNMATPHIGRPPSPIYRICNVSRNPADFSSADPGNIYIRFDL